MLFHAVQNFRAKRHDLRLASIEAEIDEHVTAAIDDAGIVPAEVDLPSSIARPGSITIVFHFEETGSDRTLLAFGHLLLDLTDLPRSKRTIVSLVAWEYSRGKVVTAW